MPKSNLVPCLYKPERPLTDKEFRDGLKDLGSFCKTGKTIVNKQRVRVPFILNVPQMQIGEALMDVIQGRNGASNEAASSVTTNKPRQIGGSQLLIAAVQYLCLTKKHLRIFYVFHTGAAGENFFEDKVIDSLKHTRPEYHAEIHRMRKNGQNQLYFKSWMGQERDNKVTFISEKSKGLGLGETAFIVICDEYAEYTNVEAIERGLLNTMPDHGFSLKFFISTFLRAGDHFHNRIDSAKKSNDPNERYVFLRWFDNPEYEFETDTKVDPSLCPTALLDSVRDKLKAEGFDDDAIQRKLWWYAKTFVDKASGRIATMQTQYPTTEDELYNSGAFNVFSTPALSSLLEKERELPERRGRLEEHGGFVEWVDDLSEDICLYEAPRAGHRYSCVIDPSENMGASGKDGDNTAILVVDMDSLAECMRIASNEYTEREWADIVWLIQRWYKCWVVVERNTGQNLITHLRQRGVPMVRRFSGEYGVRTTMDTKRQWVRALQGAIAAGVYKPRGTKTLEEFIAYAYIDDRMKRMGGVGKYSTGEKMHDDRVMVSVIAQCLLRKHTVSLEHTPYEGEDEESETGDIGVILMGCM